MRPRTYSQAWSVTAAPATMSSSRFTGGSGFMSDMPTPSCQKHRWSGPDVHRREVTWDGSEVVIRLASISMGSEHSSLERAQSYASSVWSGNSVWQNSVLPSAEKVHAQKCSEQSPSVMCGIVRVRRGGVTSTVVSMMAVVPATEGALVSMTFSSVVAPCFMVGSLYTMIAASYLSESESEAESEEPGARGASIRPLTHTARCVLDRFMQAADTSRHWSSPSRNMPLPPGAWLLMASLLPADVMKEWSLRAKTVSPVPA